MSQGKRIQQVRKSLGFTMEKFGNHLGVTKSTISNIENGNRNATEQFKKSVCREFSVNPAWLSSGEGEAFMETDNAIIATIDRVMAGENEFHKNLFKGLAKMSETDLLALESIIDKFLDIKKDQRES